MTTSITETILSAIESALAATDGIGGRVWRDHAEAVIRAEAPAVLIEPADEDITGETTCRYDWLLRVRLEGVDCPELHGGTPADRARAAQAREFTAAWLAQGPAIVATTGRTTFERWLAQITRGEDSLADALVAAGLARRVA